MIDQNTYLTTVAGAVIPRSPIIEIKVGARLELDLDQLSMPLIEELREANRVVGFLLTCFFGASFDNPPESYRLVWIILSIN